MCNLDDLALAFDEYQITLPSLQEYLEEVDQLPFPHEVFQFPVKQPNKHVYESPILPVTIGSSTQIGENSDDNNDDEEEAWSPLILSYLPPLPTKEETEKGKQWVKRLVILSSRHSVKVSNINIANNFPHVAMHR